MSENSKAILAIGETAEFTKPSGETFIGTVEGRNFSFDFHTGYTVKDSHRRIYNSNAKRETGYACNF